MSNLFENEKFKEFIKNFVFFISFFSIAFFLLLHVYHKNKNPVISTETSSLLLILLFLIGFTIKSLLLSSSESKDSMYFVGILSFSIFIQWIINISIEFFSKKLESNNKPFENYFKKLGIVIFTTIINVGICIYILNNLTKGSNLSDLISNFNKEVKYDYYYFIFFLIMFFLYSLQFTSLYSNTTKSSLILPSYLAIYILLTILVFIIYLGLKIKLIDTNQILTTIIVLTCLFSLFIYIWLYMVIDSINTICKNKKKEENKEKKPSLFNKILIPFLIISIFVLIWIIDTKKWSKLECGIYLIITLILLTSFNSISTKYPNLSFLSMWLLVEWIFVTYYNWINVQNSFQCLFNS